MNATFDRAAATVGNIVKFEHLNTRVPDQTAATLFYVMGLGLTRDPYLSVGVTNMWINVGRQQFHLPTGAPQVVRGVTGLVVPDLGELADRLKRVAEPLAGTRFAFARQDDAVDVVSPWGNRIRCHAPDRGRFGGVRLGMPYVEFDAPAGTAAGIARFYREILGAPADTVEGGKAARVAIGEQWLLFRETAAPLADYDAHHVQVYVADFAGPYEKLKARGLISTEDSAHQYRFVEIVDPADGRPLYRLEHEVRSLLHAGYGRELVNRNPAQTLGDYVPGNDSLGWALP
ncbi:MAG: VOC family protein [Alphaproteobacteria bacterium]